MFQAPVKGIDSRGEGDGRFGRFGGHEMVKYQRFGRQSASQCLSP